MCCVHVMVLKEMRTEDPQAALVGLTQCSA
jgi:hypothetical protein